MTIATKRAAVQPSTDCEYGMRCGACGRRTYTGLGHVLGCATKARSVAYNLELRERLDRAEVLS